MCFTRCLILVSGTIVFLLTGASCRQQDGRVEGPPETSGSEEPISRIIKGNGAALSISLSQDGNLLAVGTDEGAVILWDTKTGKTKGRITLQEKDKGKGCAVSLSPDGKQVITGTSQGAKLWDIATGKEVGPLGERAYDAAFSTDGKLLVVLTLDANYKIDVLIRDNQTGKERIVPVPGYNHNSAEAISPDCRYLAWYEGGDVRLFDLVEMKAGATLEVGKRIHNGQIVFSPNSKRLAAFSSDWGMKIWEVMSGKEVLHVPAQRIINALAFTPDGKQLVIVSRGNSVQFWDAGSGETLLGLFAGKERFPSKPVRLTSIAFRADGTQVVVGDEEGNIRLWKLGLASDRDAMARFEAACKEKETAIRDWGKVTKAEFKNFRRWVARSDSIPPTYEATLSFDHVERINPELAVAEMVPAHYQDQAGVWLLTPGSIDYLSKLTPHGLGSRRDELIQLLKK